MTRRPSSGYEPAVRVESRCVSRRNIGAGMAGTRRNAQVRRGVRLNRTYCIRAPVVADTLG